MATRARGDLHRRGGVAVELGGDAPRRPPKRDAPSDPSGSNGEIGSGTTFGVTI